MDLNITDELVKFLKKNHRDFVTLSGLPDSLKKNLTNKKKPANIEIKEVLTPHLGNVLMVKKGGRSDYLAFKQTEDELLFRVVQSRSGKSPGQMAVNIPFSKKEFISVLNRLLEQGKVQVRLGDNYNLKLYPADNTAFRSEEKRSEAEQPEPVPPVADVSEEKFRAAFQELERGKFYVRICDMRRRLNWPEKEFDAMLRRLRDAGKLQLQGGDTDYFTPDELQASFVDENNFRMLTMMWRQ
ncbi:MAG: hypothetical protein LBR61_07545 [Synergistaceae bacterium]|nr:hypothetical protein [Synergistaceae bacterium]